MMWIVILCGVAFGVVAYVVARCVSHGRADVVYHWEKYVFHNDEIRCAKGNVFVRVYADIVYKKMCHNMPVVYSALDKCAYDDLCLMSAPVYVTARCNIYGNVEMLVRAVEIINKKINIVCKNVDKNINKINIKNPNIQIYFINEKINKKYNFLFNALNINYPHSADKMGSVCNICHNYYENKIIKIIKNKNNNLILPKNNYGYFLYKNKNIYSVTDIFGKGVYEFDYSGRVRLDGRVLHFVNTCNGVVDMRISDSGVTESVALVEACAIVSADDDICNVSALMHLARRQLHCEPLRCIQELNDFHNEVYRDQMARQGMRKYIMCANFARDYFARYYYLIKHVYGVSATGLVKPDMRYAGENFAVYVGDECVAEYENGKKILAKLKKI